MAEKVWQTFVSRVWLSSLTTKSSISVKTRCRCTSWLQNAPLWTAAQFPHLPRLIWKLAVASSVTANRFQASLQFTDLSSPTYKPPRTEAARCWGKVYFLNFQAASMQTSIVTALTQSQQHWTFLPQSITTTCCLLSSIVFCVLGCFACIHVCAPNAYLVPAEVRKHQKTLSSGCRWLWASTWTWALGIKTGSYTRAARALHPFSCS